MATAKTTETEAGAESNGADTSSAEARTAKVRKTREAKTFAFDVYRVSEDDLIETNPPLAENVKVTIKARGESADMERRRDAIRQATADLPEDEKTGRFGTCPAGAFVVIQRGRKAEPVDEWA